VKTFYFGAIVLRFHDSSVPSLSSHLPGERCLVLSLEPFVTHTLPTLGLLFTAT